MAEEIPKQGKAAVVVNEGPDFHVEMQMIDVPEPKDDELLVRLNCTGLCMSDVHFMLNDWALPKMSVFGTRCAGHEGAGVVVKKGKSVSDAWKLGDRVGIKPIKDVCHNCEECWNGRENYCPGGIHTGLMSPGTYQQYLVSPAIYTTRIPDGVEDAVAGPIMCSAATMHRALVDSGLKPGSWVVFPGGGGGVGIQGVQLARAMGMRPIVVDGTEKKDLCMKMGAEAFVDFKVEKDVGAKVREIADGIGAHGVLVTAYQSYKDVFTFTGTRKGARIMAIALPPAGAVNLGAEPSAFIFNNVHIIGTLVGTMQDAAAALDYAKRGLLKPIHEVRGCSRWNESVQALRKGEIAGRIVMDFNKD